ncbi:MAG TPA: type IV pilus assembly protein PilM [Gemmataceae bacterium]|nr:type IV pilus assembly protein PilM [Gemmataceae bacterium]
MAAVQPGVWGVDLGQCALKALRLEVQDGQVQATAFDYVEHPKILSQPDADPDQLTREALEKFLSRNTLRGDLVAISVPGQSGLARFVKLPPVEEKKIGDIVKFEAKQQIPFNLDEVVWDYQKVSSGIVTDGFALETEIGLFAMKRDMVTRYLQHFKDVNVEVHLVQMAPLCLCNYVAYDLLNVDASSEAAEAGGKRQCVVALDIGADSCNLIVTDGHRIIWQRPIPLGGNHFTRALTKDLKLTFAKAEHLKRNATKSGPELKKILTALKPVLNDFAGEVQRSLGYFTNTHRDAQIEYMMGLGSAFRLPGLQRFLAEKLQLDVRKLQKLERLGGEGVISAPAFTENVLSFAVAYGLAIQGLKVARLQTNLLPPEIRTERLVRAKKPWAAAAAAALLLGTGGYVWSYYWENRAVNIKNEPLKAALTEAEGAVSIVKKKNDAFSDQKKETEKEERAVRSIIAGQDEKLNWLALNRFVADALPQPDLTNVPAKAWERYDRTRAGNAYKEYLKRLQNPTGGQRIDTTGLDNDLIQFNIESLDARFCDDLAAYWAKMKTNLTDEKDKVRPLSHWDLMPKEKETGWVVELRGYTNHEDGVNFTLKVLVQALADAGARDAPAPAAPGAPGVKPAAAAADAAKPASTDPVVGLLSHVVLYQVDDKNKADLRHTGYVAGLVGTSSGGTGQGPGGPAAGGLVSGSGPASPSGSEGSGLPGGAGKAPAGRSSWSPLVTSRAGETGSGKSGGGGPGTGGLGGVPPPGTGGAKTPPIDKQVLNRTEFVVLFIWKENTPSDALRSTTVAGGDTAAPAGGPGMMGPGMGGAPAMPTGLGAGPPK